MAELSAAAKRTTIRETAGIGEPDDAPPLAPLAHAPDRIMDLAHLHRMTAGDETLRREVLELFSLQCNLLMERMRGEKRADIAALAHTLSGSARGIGAWIVVDAAEAVERNAAAGSSDLAPAVERLDAAVTTTTAAIAALDRRR